MTALPVMEVEIKFPWWTDAYVQTVIWFCWTFGTEPDVDKVIGTILSHCSFRVAGK